MYEEKKSPGPVKMLKQKLTLKVSPLQTHTEHSMMNKSYPVSAKKKSVGNTTAPMVSPKSAFAFSR